MLATDIDTSITRLAQGMRNPERARLAAEEAVQMAQARVAIEPASVESRDFLSQAQSALGTAYRASGDLERAVECYRAAVAVREQLVREQPGIAGYRRS